MQTTRCPIRRGTKLTLYLQVGKPGDAVTFINACRTVAAELVYLHGEALMDSEGEALPSIMDSHVFIEEQEELDEAVRIMEDWSHFPQSLFPRFAAVQIVSASLRPRKSEWDLVRLERVFKNAYETLRGTLHDDVDDEEADEEEETVLSANSILVRIVKSDQKSRLTRLLSALCVLSAECGNLLTKIAASSQSASDICA